MSRLPFAFPEVFISLLQRDVSDVAEELWLIFNGSKLLVHHETFQPLQKKEIFLTRSIYLGKFNQVHVYVGESIEKPLESDYVDVKMLYGKLDERLYAVVGKASHLLVWDRTHQFCGRCGGQMRDKEEERAKVCRGCRLEVFPKISPAVMALVQKGDEILLARSPHFPKGVYSVLAGFVEPGETVEQCLKREVFEEVGLHVDEISYFGSQPWPFPDSLMIAFSCRWKAGDITINDAEIEDAQWFKKDRLPPLPPPISISRFLIESVSSRSSGSV